MLRTSVHGHEVIELLMESGRPWTRKELLAEMGRRYGEDCHFHTCACEHMTAAQLLDFLEARGKFVPAAGGLVVDRSKLCGHHH